MKLSFKLFKRLSKNEKKITVPTVLTIARILCVPLIVLSMIFHHWGIAFWLIVFAALTDIFDGFLARLLNQKTFLGACLDPVADKLLVLSCYFTLAFYQSPLFSIPTWFVWLVLTKELILLGAALAFYLIKGWLKVQPTLLGKLTMAVQVAFIIWLFACYFFHWLPFRTYHFMLGLVLILAISSLVQYVTIGYQWFKTPLKNS